MNGLVITQAALHAALVCARDSGSDAGLDALVALLDPAHAATTAPHTFHAPSLAAEEAQPAHHDHLTAEPGAAADTAGASSAAAGAPAPEAPLPAQAAEGRQPSNTIPGKWTPERIALLTEHLPTCVDRPALLARINERPGLPIATVKAMMVKARALGIQVEPWVPRAIETAAGERGGRTSVQVGQPTKTSEVRTAERFAAFPALWMDPALSVADIHARMNAMPGAEVKTGTQLYGWAKKAGLPTQRPLPPADIEDEDDAAEAAAPEASEPPPAPPAPAPEPAPPAARTLNPRNSKAGPALTGEVSAKADAFDAFTAGQTVRQVADEFGIGLNTISTWHAEWMRAPTKDAAA